MPEQPAQSLAEMIRGNATTIGDRIAFTFEGRDVTYRDLDRVSNRVANALLAEGVDRGDRIAFLDKNTLELFELMFGAAKVGAVLCPVNWRLAPPRSPTSSTTRRRRLFVVGQDLVDVLDACESSLASDPRVLIVGAHPRHPGVHRRGATRSPTRIRPWRRPPRTS